MNVVILASAEAPALVADLGIVLAAAAVFGYLAERLKLVAIVGYLVAGALIGPLALGWIDSIELVEQLGEIGIIFLMFFIGLEMSGDRLRRMGTMLLGGGPLQVVLTIVIVVAVLLFFGVDLQTGIFTGCLIALSSTAVVLKLLENRKATESPVGETSIALLIFQDIAIVFMVLLVPMLGQEGITVGDILIEMGKAVLVMVGVLLVVRWLIPRVLDRAAGFASEEVFLLLILAAAGGIAYAVTLIGLTTSLGAFIAGLVVSAGAYREIATDSILPFQEVFAAVFFASIGMQLDLRFVAENLLLILGISAAVVVVKIIGVGVAVRLLGRHPALVAATAILLAQIGEFSLILVQVGGEVGLTPAGAGEDGRQVFIATAILLIALTPVLYDLSIRVGTRIWERSVDRVDPTVDAATG